MNKKLDQYCTRLKEEFKTAEKSLSKVGAHLEYTTEKSVEAMEVELKKAKEKCEEKKELAVHAGQRLRQFLEETKKDAVTKLEIWKTDREIEKIEKEADKMEQQALDAIVVAAYAILEAEVSVVDALKFRKMAVEVAG